MILRPSATAGHHPSGLASRLVSEHGPPDGFREDCEGSPKLPQARVSMCWPSCIPLDLRRNMSSPADFLHFQLSMLHFEEFPIQHFPSQACLYSQIVSYQQIAINSPTKYGQHTCCSSFSGHFPDRNPRRDFPAGLSPPCPSACPRHPGRGRNSFAVPPKKCIVVFCVFINEK